MPRKSALEGGKLEKAVEMKKNGASYPEIAEEFNVSQGAAYNNVKPLLEEESEGGPENETRRIENESERDGAQNECENENESVENESERTPETQLETKRLSETPFRKCLHLFIDGKNSEQIAERLNVPQAAVEYELLPYVNELKTTRKLQRKVKGMTK